MPGAWLPGGQQRRGLNDSKNAHKNIAELFQGSVWFLMNIIQHCGVNLNISITVQWYKAAWVLVELIIV